MFSHGSDAVGVFYAQKLILCKHNDFFYQFIWYFNFFVVNLQLIIE